MSKRFFTADFHLGMGILLDKKVMGKDARPFTSVHEMNERFLNECNQKAKVYYRVDQLYNANGLPIIDQNGQISTTRTVIDRDVIIHVGDVACFRSDREIDGLEMKPQEFIQKINAQFVNIRGNHDVNNKVKSLCSSMQTSLGRRFQNVTVGHYPSYDPHARGTFKEGWIHLCGHVHSKFKHCLDMTNMVLNINVGVDVWNYTIVSEEELVKYIVDVLRLPKEKVNKVKIIGDKLVRV